VRCGQRWHQAELLRAVAQGEARVMRGTAAEGVVRAAAWLNEFGGMARREQGVAKGAT
jgi:hypothetical protein